MSPETKDGLWSIWCFILGFWLNSSMRSMAEMGRKAKLYDGGKR